MKYPTWICLACGEKYGREVTDIVATWHLGKCDICGKEDAVTEPRDFGHVKMELIRGFKRRKK